MKTLITFWATALFVGFAYAQQKLEIDPYAETGMEAKARKVKLIKVKPEELNVLPGSTAAKLSTGLKLKHPNFMCLWAEGSGTNFMEWQLEVPEAGEYDVTAMVQAGDCQLTVNANDQSSSRRVQEKKWNRVGLGTMALVAGANRLRLDIDSKELVHVSALEIVRPKIKEEMLADAMSLRKSPDWFKDAGYGLMFQWVNRVTPPSGPIKEWEQKVNDFDIDSMIDMVEASGASFVVWSVVWGQQYISAPIKALDQIIAGRTTKRDLLGEIADRLHAKGLRLIFYYHYGYDCYHSKDPDWMDAAGGYLADKAKLYENVMNIVSEIGRRYGNKLDGWFFDGGHRYYDTHFDMSEAVGISSAPFKEIGMAARTGNQERILCYNPWKLPRLTEYQDYFAGEAQINHENLKDGVFVDGGQKGLMGFGCFVLEDRWGHIQKNKTIAAPRFSTDVLAKKIEHAKRNRYPIAINLEMYEDGSVSPKSVELLKAVRRKLEENSKK